MNYPYVSGNGNVPSCTYDGSGLTYATYITNLSNSTTAYKNAIEYSGVVAGAVQVAGQS